ncbi:peptidyl-prolyl cis-trans isomerase [uncultured Roseivirga sp.]|uniref:peptidyl-prolyl cis-trans isomerase n=1 Tax=uncultured Roseivirga sp. TaxID=543088 RepID=UPI0030DD14A5|tara:strand:+ start:42532 stop:43407 length:876 start_codon:yes stop_codon:yes gene_type:complete
MKKGKYYILLITLLAFSSCEFLGMESENTVDNSENLVARVGNTFLFRTDINGLTDASMSSEDSARITERFIDNWIKKELFVREASNNSNIDQTEIQRKVDAYRYTLISYEYQKLMVEQQLDREVSEEEIRQYYNDNIENFQLRQNILKGRYLKILQAAQKKADVRRWMKSDRPEDLESLKSYGFQFASDFSLQDSTWINFDDLIKNSPFSTIENKIQFLRRNRYVEESDSLYLYLFRIHEFKLSEQVSPMEYVKEDIKNIIINKRKVDIAKSLENKVYERAKKNEDYEIYK